MGEIRGYGGEIRGEISQHLAAHTHTRPSWETLRSKQGGHERDASTVAKGRRFFLPFLISLSLCPRLSRSRLPSIFPSFNPPRRFSRTRAHVHCGLFSASQRLEQNVQQTSNTGCNRSCLEGAKQKNTLQVEQVLQRVGVAAPLTGVLGTWLCSRCLTRTYGSLMSQRS